MTVLSQNYPITRKPFTFCTLASRTAWTLVLASTLLLFTACNDLGVDPDTSDTRTSLRADDAAHTFIQGFNAQNPNELSIALAPNVEVNGVEKNASIQGANTFIEMGEAWWIQVPDLQLHPREVVADGNRVMMHVNVSGTPAERSSTTPRGDEDHAFLSPDGEAKAFDADAFMFFEVRDSRIERLQIRQDQGFFSADSDIDHQTFPVEMFPNNDGGELTLSSSDSDLVPVADALGHWIQQPVNEAVRISVDQTVIGREVVGVRGTIQQRDTSTDFLQLYRTKDDLRAAPPIQHTDLHDLLNEGILDPIALQ